MPSPSCQRSQSAAGLARLLESDLFTLPMCVAYIARHKNDEAALAALLDCLATKFSLEDVESYIPQLGTFLVLPHTEHVVDKFVLKACARRMSFALKAIWYVESVSPERAGCAILEKMETGAINRTFRQRQASGEEALTTEQHLGRVEAEVRAKDRLCQYFYSTKHFVARLTELSAQVLRKLPRADRAARLAEELDQISAQLPAVNVSLPCDAHYRRLVRVPSLPQRFRVLNSRERAPFLVLFEYVQSGQPHDPPPLSSEAAPAPTAVRGPAPIVEEHFQPTPADPVPHGAAGVKPASFSATAQSLRATVEAGGFQSVMPIGGYGVCGWESPPPVTPSAGTTPRSSPTMAGGRAGPQGINPSYFSAAQPPAGADVFHNASLCDAPSIALPIRAAPPSPPPPRDADAVLATASPRHSPASRPRATGPLPPHRGPAATSDDAEQHERRMTQFFGQPWAKTVAAASASSPYSSMPGWGVLPIIVKGGDDMRQEVLAMQLISAFDRIWKSAGLPLKLYVYTVVVTSHDSGFIELVSDSASIDSLKKALPEEGGRSLLDYWQCAYGDKASPAYRAAQRNFVESMAAYSVVSYILQLKDRHNANILIRRDGQVVHIDFGFMLSTSPGGVNFESMPFKLSQESVDVMGGLNSGMFQYFRMLVYAAFKEAAKYSDQIISLAEITAEGPPLPCFGNDTKAALEALRSRFLLGSTDADLAVWVRDAIDQSVDNWRARGYDRFQKWSNGIL
eukprot:TRINITY_DN374_c3_g1_i1.p1 TRINITY_DN374_c3_g1~~TRINITY_DN374_c3_g1_i1.p1  ORF type:complete len:762 (+),score=208.12 TRINITY_DN374_c3_g1_i1:68-2287(+)